MNITEEKLERVAKFASIQLLPEEKEKYLQKMSELIGQADKLNEVDTEGVEPTFITTNVNVFREDIVQPSTPRDEMLTGAPAKAAGCYLVPKTIAESEGA